ncbi:D-alanyl-D-alanine carboxypeptidase [Candidatus Curtissbacteria bacterium]|nr:D-alanyl-D-alanine carboxypeptidase [Candidatus Curtissbacteria bacterium]
MKLVRPFVFFLIIIVFVLTLLYSGYLPLLKVPKKLNIGQTAQLSPYPVKVDNFQDAQQLTARAATVIDNKTGITLYEKNPTLKHLPASTTKLMTAIVALERCLPQTVITVGYVQPEGTKMGLAAGDKVTVETLLYGLLIPSGNDAAYVLAYSCSDSYEDFLAAMNRKAKELGMTDSHFANPAGFDDKFQYSTARDLTKLSRAAVANPLIAKIVKTRSVVVSDVNGTKAYYLENVNKLLGVVPGLEGVKTGQTEGSLENLVTYTNRSGKGVITVVLGSQDRFGESQSLIEWAYKNHSWVNP